MFTTRKDAFLRPRMINTKHIEDQQTYCFFRKIELKVLRDKEAYLLTDLLQDIKK